MAAAPTAMNFADFFPFMGSDEISFVYTVKLMEMYYYFGS